MSTPNPKASLQTGGTGGGGGGSTVVVNDLTSGGTTSALSAEMGKTLQANKADTSAMNNALALKAPLDSAALTGTPTTTAPAVNDNSTRIPTTSMVQAAIAQAVSGLLTLKGGLDCSASPNYPAAAKGDTYYVTVAGKIGGASGTTVAVGDQITCSTANAGGTQAAVGSSWFILQHQTQGVLLASNNLGDVGSAATALANLGGAANSAVVHNTGNETIAGIKTFSSAPVVPAGAFPESAVANLPADLAAKAAKTQVASRDVFISGSVSNGDLTLVVDAKVAFTIVESTTKAGAGTGSATIKVNGVAIGGTANAISTTKDTQAHATANTVNVGDIVTVTISGASSLSDVAMSIKVNQTLS